jgi:N,N'-diacetyllegionaminate synthase
MVSKKSERTKFKFPKKPYKVFIIAEAGVNHNGRKDLALKLVRKAASAGSDAIKFQTFKANQVVSDLGKMASYQKDNLNKNISQKEMLSNLELKEGWYPDIIAECERSGIMFMSTPHGGRDSVKFLNPYIRVWKVGSGDLLNFILLDEISQTKKPVILSSGMHSLKEIKQSIIFLQGSGYKNDMISVLHCTTKYPCPPDKVNLAAMKTMIDKLYVTVGYSDHTEGNQVAVMATTLGAKVYECHLTLDKNLPGPDHKASCEPVELTERIKMIRRAQEILGNDNKEPTKEEIEEMKPLVTRSIVAKWDLPRGHVLNKEDLEAKRPGDGVSPSKYEKFVGKKLKKSKYRDEKILFADIK